MCAIDVLNDMIITVNG